MKAVFLISWLNSITALAQDSCFAGTIKTTVQETAIARFDI